jgi:hypothetical protein
MRYFFFIVLVMFCSCRDGAEQDPITSGRASGQALETGWREKAFTTQPYVFLARGPRDTDVKASDFLRDVERAIDDGALVVTEEDGWFEVPGVRGQESDERFLVSDTRPDASLFGATCMPAQVDVSCSAMRGLSCRDGRCLCSPAKNDESTAAKAARVPSSIELEQNRESPFTIRSYASRGRKWAATNVSGLAASKPARSRELNWKIAPTTWWLPNESRCMTSSERRAIAVSGKVSFATKEASADVIKFGFEDSEQLEDGVRYRVERLDEEEATEVWRLSLDCGSKFKLTGDGRPSQEDVRTILESFMTGESQ